MSLDRAALRPPHPARRRAGDGRRRRAGRGQPGRGGGRRHGAAGRPDQAGGVGPRRDRARRVPHAGEPLLRPLLRDLSRRPGLRRPPARLPRELRPGLAGRARPHAAPLPSRQRLGHGRVHPGPRPQLAGRAHELGRRHQRRLRQHARAAAVPGPRARRPHHGLLPPAGPALLLRAGRRLHHLRQLPLLGARADPPQPPHGALGHGRPDGAAPVARSSSPTSRPRPSGARTGTPCPRCSRTPG